MLLPALIAAVSLAAETPDIPEASIQISEPRISTERRLGGVMAPAALPAGAMAVYAMLGAPDLGGGFRQGFSLLELEVRLMFNYLLASAALEIGVRVPVYEKGMVQMAPSVAVGFEANSGSRYYDRANFGYLAVRPRVGLITSLRFSDTVSGLVLFDLPWSIPVTVQGTHVVPTVGAGAEIHLGGNMSGFVMANVGFDAIKEPLGVTQLRPGWAIRLGLGFRLF
jgi:hypothetical protein